MTLPPVPPAMRQQLSLPVDSSDLIVPQFVTLYRHLGRRVLEDSDASSLVQNQSYQREGTEDELSRRRMSRTRTALLIKLLRETCVQPVLKGRTGQALSMSLRETGVLVAAYLQESLEPSSQHDTGATSRNSIDETEYMMEGDIEEFRTKVDDIAFVTGQYIIDCERTIREILATVPTEATSAATASTKIPSKTSRNVSLTMTTRKHQPTNQATSSSSSSSLLEQHLQQHTKLLIQTLPATLSNLTTTLQSLLTAQTSILTLQIQHLETFTHSTQSRNLITHAQFLSTVSKGIALKAQVLALLHEKETYAQQGIQPALINVMASLIHEEADLTRRERDLKSLLSEYDAYPGGEDIFKTLGIEYSRVGQDIEDVKKDIERLEQQSQGQGQKQRH